MLASVDVAQAPHQGIYLLAIAGASGELQQPFPEGSIERFPLRAGYLPRLLNEVFIGAQSNVFHTIPVYTMSV